MVGPVLDADGVAVTDGVVADFEGSVNGGDPAALNGSATLTHRGVGFYSLALTATDLATVGSFQVLINDTVNACPMKDITVVEEAVYDAFYAASAVGYVANQPVDVNTIKTQTVTCAAGVTIRADVGAAAAPGAANGMLVGGSNAATTFAGLTTGALSCTTLTASGAVAFQSTFAVTTSTALGALSCTTLTASGAVAFQSTFAVTTSTALAALSATTITASGTTSLAAVTTSGTVTMNALTVSNATTLTGAVSLGSTLGITGAITATNASNNITLGTFTVTTNAIAWNAAWDTEVQSECNDALVANNLDHLCLTATSGADMTTEVADNTIFSRILANGDTSVFDPSTDGLQPIRDQVVAIDAKTTNLPSDPADASVIAGRFDTLDTSVADVEGKVDDLETRLGTPSDLGSGATVAANLVDIESQTDDLAAFITRLTGLVMAQGTIGSTGNSTTALHLTGLTYGDDELNDYLLVIRDVSESEYHARWIADWDLSDALATVATLPFTPQNATDTYWLLPIRQDVTGGSGLDAAGVRDAIGLASANLDTQLSGIQSDTNDIQTRLPAALVNSRMDCTIDGTGMETGAVDSILNRDASASTTNSTLGAIVNDWENGGRLDLIVDDILADTAEIGAAGAGLTNINLPNQTMDIVGSITGNITGNLSGSVGSVSGAVGSIATGGIAEASFATTAGTFHPLNIVDQGTAQSAGATTLVLRAAAAFADDELIGARVLITGGTTGVGQSRLITDYVGATDTATVSAWQTEPTGTITYKIFGSTASAGGAAPTAAEVADAVWDEDATGHQTQGSFGQAIGDPAADTNTIYAAVVTGAAGATIAADIIAVKAETATILADTNELQTDWVNGGRLDLLIDATLADTNELQTDWVNGGRLDNILDARASQTSVDDLPTNAELASSQAAADDATLAAIAALNNISTAQVNAEVDTALADVGLTTTITGRIDVATSTRMATYTQPTGFLAATFPGTVASTTNITAGTITTVTNLTNAPTAGDLTATMKASVNAEVLDVISTDTFAEPGQGTPGATVSLAVKLGWVYASWRNQKDNDGTQTQLYADNGSTVIAKQTTSESAGTVTKGEWQSGA